MIARVARRELLRREAIREGAGLLREPTVQRRTLRFGTWRIDHAIAPVDRESVKRSHATDEILGLQAVTRLRDVVLARVVHDRRTHAVHPRERRAAQRVDGERRRGDHVVLQAERVADFVRDHLTHRLAHQLFRDVERAGGRVGRTRLHHQPIAVRAHVVVIPRDLAVDDLARARIVRMRTSGVAREARRPAHDGVARIIRIEVGILRLGGRVLGENGVLESGLLEHLLPVLHALTHVPLPACRGGRVEVVHDGLDRLNQFPARVGSGIFRFQTPARDELLALGLLHIEAVVHAVHREVAYARVGIARTHRRFG